MTAPSPGNTRVLLARRPKGAPRADDFRIDTVALPEPSEGEMRLKTLYLSLDPYMRLRMNDGVSYADPVAVGEPMCGGTVCRVEASRHPDYSDGDLVLAFTGWQTHAISNGEGLMRLERRMAHPSWALGVLGMPGFTAYYGLLHIGAPKAGETVVVAAATGAVGSMVGQIARLKGCHVVGVAGGADKCRYAVETLGFDACIDHRAADFDARLAAACADGIDVYFENVGGAVFDAVLPLVNVGARVPLCGVIAWYDADGLPPGPDRTPALMRVMLVRQVKMQGFVIIDQYPAHYRRFLEEMGHWLEQGKIVVREDVSDGLDKAPAAFMGLLRGDNFGKVVIRVAADD